MGEHEAPERAPGQEARREFSKLIKEITLQARRGDPNPDTNAGLAQAVDRAKASNLPKDTIERAIKRGTGSERG